MRSANYVEETTTSIAGTSGDGAITLTAVTNVPRFSTVFGTQATTIRYVIEDTVNKKFETGVGSVASNVLTRTLPQVTWDGTTYDDSTPTALQFGSSPTSGNIKVRLSATAESQSPNIFGTNTTLAGDSNWRNYPISNEMPWGSNGSGSTLTVNREYYLPYLLTQPGSLNGVQLEVTTAVAGANIKSALYSAGTGGLPTSKIVDFNVLSGATTGFKTDTTTGTWSPSGAVYLPAGWYYFAFITDQAIALRAGATNYRTSRNPLGRADAYGYAACAYASGNYTTGLPLTGAPSSLLGQATNSTFWVGLKVAS